MGWWVLWEMCERLVFFFGLCLVDRRRFYDRYKILFMHSLRRLLSVLMIPA